MGGRGNFGGGFGGGNMQQLFRQAQKMQQDMNKAQEELASTEVTGSASGGMVEVVMLGNKTVSAIKIKPEAVDPDDIEMLEDLIIAAFNDASAKADALSQKLLGPMAGNLGGLF
jgi:DNA-binding protein, YbaB/EbfC family